MRKVLLTLTAAIMMVGLSAQSIGWAKLASVDANGINYNNPTVGVNVGGDFDIVLSYEADEFDFAVRKAMSFSFVRVGTLDDPESLSPDIHIFTASKQLWVSIPDDLPSSRDYYDAKEYWSNNSLKRMEVELNKS